MNSGVIVEGLRGRRVLLTGHTGFKGAWLATWLGHLGAEVHGLALDPLAGSLYERAGVKASMASDNRGDIRDPEVVRQVMVATQPELVLHLAAQPLVRDSYQRPIHTFETNVMGTAYVLEAARSAKATAVLVITTDKVYRNEEVLWGYREPDALGGDDPYSASKAAAEVVTHAMRSVMPSTAVGTARAGNVIGGGDVAEDRLLPDLFRDMDRGTPTRIRNPAAVRPWQHVLDSLHGYLLLAERLLRGDACKAWNIGPHSHDLMTVAEVATAVCGILPGTASWEPEGGTHPHEAGLLLLDSTLMRSQIGWQPMLSTRQAIEWTVEWEVAVRSGTTPIDATLRQLERFETLLSD
jgi:CDP-glucose 4,6-dehydratase